MLGVNVSRYLKLFGVKLFSKYSNLCDYGTLRSWTDGRTDRRIENILWHNRALCSIVR